MNEKSVMRRSICALCVLCVALLIGMLSCIRWNDDAATRAEELFCYGAIQTLVAVGPVTRRIPALEQRRGRWIFAFSHLHSSLLLAGFSQEGKEHHRSR